jgi:GTP-binding protein
MIPADSTDIKNDYRILLNELETYNPELAGKQRILAITKCDMLDEVMIEQMKNELPAGIATVFISSVSGLGLQELKDLIWEELNKEVNQVIELVHRPMVIQTPEVDEDAWDEEQVEEEEEDEEEDISRYKGIGWDDL